MRKVPPISELRKICQPDTGYRSVQSQRARALSIYFTKLFLYTPMSANQITVLMGVISLVGIAIFVTGNPIFIIVGCLLSLSATFLDYVDGEVARYQGTGGLEGAFLDALVHQVQRASLFLFLTFGMYRDFSHVAVILVGGAATLAYVIRDSLWLTTCIAIVERTLGKRTRARVRDDEASIPAPALPTKGLSGFLVGLYQNRLRRPLYSFFGLSIEVILLAAIADLFLNVAMVEPPIRLTAVFSVVVIHGTIGLLDSLVRTALMVKTRDIQSAYVTLIQAISTPENPDGEGGDISRTSS